MAELTENQDLVLRLLAEGRDPVAELGTKKANPSVKSLIDKGYLKLPSLPYEVQRLIFTVKGRNYITNVTRAEQNVGTGNIPQAQATDPFRT